MTLVAVNVVVNNRDNDSGTQNLGATLFSFGYWRSGSATTTLVAAIDEAESWRGFEPPLWVDVRISRSVRAAGFRDRQFAELLESRYVWMPERGNKCVEEGRCRFPLLMSIPSAIDVAFLMCTAIYISCLTSIQHFRRYDDGQHSWRSASH